LSADQHEKLTGKQPAEGVVKLFDAEAELV